MDKDLLLQKMPLFACGELKGREAGGLGESHRKRGPWSLQTGPALELGDGKLTPGRDAPSSLLPEVPFPLQMVFDESNCTDFLPCGLCSGLTC